MRINQAAIIALFRVVNRYVGNLPPMPGRSESKGYGNCGGRRQNNAVSLHPARR
jgi:hypothetical protein